MLVEAAWPYRTRDYVPKADATGNEPFQSRGVIKVSQIRPDQLCRKPPKLVFGMTVILLAGQRHLPGQAAKNDELSSLTHDRRKTAGDGRRHAPPLTRPVRVGH